MADPTEAKAALGSRGGGIVLALCALAVCAGACNGGRESASAAPRRDRVVIGVRADVSSFNPYTATNAFTQEIADLLFPRLAFERDDFGQGPPSFEPALASSWALAADGLTLTVALDRGARWSDGEPIDADDVLYAHRAATDERVAWIGRDTKTFIQDVTAPDPQTVVIRFSRSYPYQLMDAFEGNVLPEHALRSVPFERWPETPFLEAGVVGGPFGLERHERGALIELRRNPDYALGPQPRLESVVFRILPDSDTLISELLSGGVDVVENVAERHLPALESAEQIEVIRAPDLSYAFVGWNTSRPLFADARVRRAMTMAIDRDALIAALVSRTGRPCQGPIPSLLWAHNDRITPLPYDPEQARALLGQVGWRDSDGDGVLDRDGERFAFVLETNQESGLRRDLVEAIAAQLRRIGVVAEPRFFEFGAVVERHERHDFDAWVGSWRESTKVDLRSVFHSEAVDGGYNYGVYRDAQLDAQIDRARAESDPAEARRLWWQVQERIAEGQPYTFLFEQDRLHAVRRDLAGFRPSPRSAYSGLEHWHWQ